MGKSDGATTISSGGGITDEDVVYASYELMQQLLPGENQDATRLEMGRTYEQVDAGEVKPRERGAAPTERETNLAQGVVNDGAGNGDSGRKGFRHGVKKLLFSGTGSSTNVI